MQPNRKCKVYDNRNLNPPQEDADTFGDYAPRPTVFVLIAKNIIIFSSAAIMIFFFVMVVNYVF